MDQSNSNSNNEGEQEAYDSYSDDFLQPDDDEDYDYNPSAEEEEEIRVYKSLTGPSITVQPKMKKTIMRTPIKTESDGTILAKRNHPLTPLPKLRPRLSTQTLAINVQKSEELYDLPLNQMRSSANSMDHQGDGNKKFMPAGKRSSKTNLKVSVSKHRYTSTYSSISVAIGGNRRVPGTTNVNNRSYNSRTKGYGSYVPPMKLGPAKAPGSVAQRVASAKRMTMNDLKNKMNVLNTEIEVLKKENRTLNNIQHRQHNALRKWEGNDAQLPRLLQQHKEEFKNSQEHVRKLNGTCREMEDKLKLKEKKIVALEAEASRLRSLVANDRLDERHELEKNLEIVSVNLCGAEKRIRQYMRHVEILEKNHQRQIVTERQKLIRANTISLELRAEIARLKLALRDKERVLNYIQMRSSGRTLIRSFHENSRSHVAKLLSPALTSSNRSVSESHDKSCHSQRKSLRSRSLSKTDFHFPTLGGNDAQYSNLNVSCPDLGENFDTRNEKKSHSTLGRHTFDFKGTKSLDLARKSEELDKTDEEINASPSYTEPPNPNDNQALGHQENSISSIRSARPRPYQDPIYKRGSPKEEEVPPQITRLKVALREKDRILNYIQTKSSGRTLIRSFHENNRAHVAKLLKPAITASNRTATVIKSRDNSYHSQRNSLRSQSLVGGSCNGDLNSKADLDFSTLGETKAQYSNLNGSCPDLREKSNDTRNEKKSEQTFGRHLESNEKSLDLSRKSEESVKTDEEISPSSNYPKPPNLNINYGRYGQGHYGLRQQQNSLASVPLTPPRAYQDTPYQQGSPREAYSYPRISPPARHNRKEHQGRSSIFNNNICYNGSNQASPRYNLSQPMNTPFFSASDAEQAATGPGYDDYEYDGSDRSRNLRRNPNGDQLSQTRMDDFEVSFFNTNNKTPSSISKIPTRKGQNAKPKYDPSFFSNLDTWK